MALIDEVTIHIAAGNGGDGVVRWRHEKYRPKAGPGGGNGGHGGHVFAEAVSDLGYLDYYLHKKNFAAQHGETGGNNGCEGANGESLTLKFPRGTILKNLETGECFELQEVGQKIQILTGGRGGLGNEHFKSSTNTTPMEWTPGTDGGEADFFVEMQLFADLGFVGLPSAGKSTLLNALTNAKSKVAAYHFTTLDPHLGAMHGYVLADIPGIIEGASQGRGLGYKFLKHIKRTQGIIHLVGCDSENPEADYDTIRNELEAYDRSLGEKQEIVLLSKNDYLSSEEVDSLVKRFKEKVGHQHVYTMTAYDDESIRAFQNVLIHYLQNRENGDEAVV